MRKTKAVERGFTIIEIMVSILLLSSALVAIFAAQFAAIASTNYARNITQATQLGRCKMNELELLFVEEGFQEGDVAESGECCDFIEDESMTDFKCEWIVETVTFPDMTESSFGDDDDEDGSGGLLQQATGGTSNMQSLMGGGEMDEMENMGMDMITSLMPMVTGLLEQAIRRVTVKVAWKEGLTEKDFQLVQYVTHPSQGPLKLMQEMNTIDDVMGGNLDGAAAGETGASGTPSTGNKSNSPTPGRRGK